MGLLLDNDFVTIIQIHARMCRLAAELAPINREPRIIHYPLSIIHCPNARPVIGDVGIASEEDVGGVATKTAEGAPVDGELVGARQLVRAVHGAEGAPPCPRGVGADAAEVADALQGVGHHGGGIGALNLGQRAAPPAKGLLLVVPVIDADALGGCAGEHDIACLEFHLPPMHHYHIWHAGLYIGHCLGEDHLLAVLDIGEGPEREVGTAVAEVDVEGQADGVCLVRPCAVAVVGEYELAVVANLVGMEMVWRAEIHGIGEL